MGGKGSNVYFWKMVLDTMPDYIAYFLCTFVAPYEGGVGGMCQNEISITSVIQSAAKDLGDILYVYEIFRASPQRF